MIRENKLSAAHVVIWKVAAATVVVLFAVLAGRSDAATNVQGTISTDTTWTLAGSPYQITNDLLVDTGAKLTIDPGVVIAFSDVQNNTGQVAENELWVKGSIAANGTSGSPIRVNTPKRITLDGAAPSHLHYVYFGQVEGSNSEIRSIGTSLDVDNALIPGLYAISTGGGTPTVSVTNTRFESAYGLDLGRQTGGSVTAAGNYLISAGYGIRATVGGSTDMEISGNVIANNGAGLNLQIDNSAVGADVDVLDNTFIRNSPNVVTSADASRSGQIEFHDNNFIGGAGPDWEHTGSGDIDAENNWWGTTNSSAIEDRITDGGIGVGEIDFDPALASVSGGAPPIDIDAPVATIGSGPSGTAASASATFTFSAGEPARFTCVLLGQTEQPCTSPVSLTGLPEGPQTFSVRAIDLYGNPGAQTTRQWRVNATVDVPTADLLANQNPALTGTNVTLNAGSSSDAIDSEIVNYEWDLNGDGVFELDTDGLSTATITSTVRATINAAVRVTTALGTSDTASLPVEFRLASPGGPVGVSINAGAQYTNDPNVTVTVRWPMLAKDLLISNDGGFGGASTLSVGATISWKLDSSGPERLPKTIYTRFTGGSSGPETYQDDIILDETAPSLTSVSSGGGGASSSSASASKKKPKSRKVKLTIRATDKTSGVGRMQIGPKKSPKLKSQKFKKSVSMRTTSKVLWVRVQDKAGNYSSWRKARL